MPRKVSFDGQGLRDRRQWPSIPPDQAQAMLDFLGWYRAVAEDALTKSAAIAEIAREDLGSAGNAQWWAHVIRAIDWLMHQVGKRQKYLEIQLAQREGRWQPQGQGRGT
jgi:hypothetical protein